MAKDPAFLFYPGDWLGGTMLLTRHQKGCYIDLLMAQFNSGPLSLDQIKTVLGQDQAMWTVLREKFKIDNSGRFFNEKLAAEIEKRKSFVQSRSSNKKGKTKTYDKSHEKHMIKHMENENENEDVIEKVGGSGEGSAPEKPKVFLPFHSKEFADVWALWKEHLRGHKKPFHTFSSEQVAVDSLKKYSEQKAIEVIKHSISSNWKNLREPEANASTGKLETAIKINQKLKESNPYK